MSKKITVAFDEETEKFVVDMSGYNNRECQYDLKRLSENLRELGVDVDLSDIHFKPPQIPENARVKEKE